MGLASPPRRSMNARSVRLRDYINLGIYTHISARAETLHEGVSRKPVIDLNVSDQVKRSHLPYQPRMTRAAMCAIIKCACSHEPT